MLKNEDEVKLNEGLKKSLGVEVNDLEVEIYYYHHRVIMKYSFSMDTAASEELRNVRETINKNYIHILNDHIVHKLNNLVDEKQIREEGRVLLYYSYMLMFVPRKEYHFSKIEDRLGTMTFKIIEPSKNFFKYGNYRFVRISIPSVIVYSSSSVGEDLKVDLINSIYQNCLYNKKISDSEDVSNQGLTKFSKNTTEKYNVMDESLLSKFWQYSIDSLGGKISDNQLQNIYNKNFYIALGAGLLSVMSIIYTIVSTVNK